MTYFMTPSRINREINRVFNGFLNSRFDGCENGECFAPRVNVREDENQVALTFEVAGMDKSDIKVTVADNVLTVSGERKEETSDEKAGYVRNEIRYGSFSRSFTLPDTVNGDSIKADYNNGLLLVTMARKEEVKPKQIEVKVK